jgi:hypothetical protein
VQSTPGDGSVFQLVLPLEAVPDPATTRGGHPAPSAGRLRADTVHG